MATPERPSLVVEPILNAEPDIGRLLWAIQEARVRTLEQIEGLTQPVVDWQPPDGESSIGSVLYHVALIEADWLYVEVCEGDIPAEVLAMLPHPVRDEQHRLTHIQGYSVADYLNQLATVRELLLDVFRTMSLDEFRRARSFPHCDVSPEWVILHLMQHEAEHRSQTGGLRIRAERALT